MKLYRVRYDNDLGVMWSWHGTKAAAEREARELRENPDVIEAEVERVDVPTSKGALIEWLNRNAADDNG